MMSSNYEHIVQRLDDLINAGESAFVPVADVRAVIHEGEEAGFGRFVPYWYQVRDFVPLKGTSGRCKRHELRAIVSDLKGALEMAERARSEPTLPVDSDVGDGGAYEVHPDPLVNSMAQAIADARGLSEPDEACYRMASSQVREDALRAAYDMIAAQVGPGSFESFVAAMEVRAPQAKGLHEKFRSFRSMDDFCAGAVSLTSTGPSGSAEKMAEALEAIDPQGRSEPSDEATNMVSPEEVGTDLGNALKMGLNGKVPKNVTIVFNV